MSEEMSQDSIKTLAVWLLFIILLLGIAGIYANAESQIKCYQCIADASKADDVCKKTQCSGKYCLKIESKQKNGPHKIKKGCLNTLSDVPPGPCDVALVKLPGTTEKVEETTCICKTDLCNGVSRPNGVISILLAIFLSFSVIAFMA